MIIGNATLLHIDCMEYMASLPDKAFDLAIVDPPYGIGGNKHTEKYKKITWDSAPPGDIYFKELSRVSKNQVVWGANYFQRLGNGAIIWNKLGEDIGRRNQAPTISDCEIAYQSFNNLVKMFSYTQIGNVEGNNYRVDWNRMDRIHPTQKPIALYEWLLTNYAKPGQRILDTHLGSGSSAIACNNLGFEMVGCELDADYYKAACSRIDQATKQERLFA